MDPLSVERLVHFNYGRCHTWFSVADALLDRKTWYCPWCGTHQEFGEVEADEEE